MFQREKSVSKLDPSQTQHESDYLNRDFIDGQDLFGLRFKKNFIQTSFTTGMFL